MISLDSFCVTVEIQSVSNKTAQAALLLYYNQKTTGRESATITTINDLFVKAGLPKANLTRLKRGLSASRLVIRGDQPNSYRLSRTTYLEFQENFGSMFLNAEQKISEAANISSTPFLNPAEVAGARKMAELYLVIHCYENSVRKMIDGFLRSKIGPHWFDVAVTKPSVKDQVRTRREREQKNKWITPRGDSPLYYLDWSDLLYILKKYEADFARVIPNFRFVESRFEEMERLRNIVAHNGALPSDDDFQHAVLSFKQWCKQVR